MEYLPGVIFFSLIVFHLPNVIFFHVSISTVICNISVNSDNTADESTAWGELSNSRYSAFSQYRRWPWPGLLFIKSGLLLTADFILLPGPVCVFFLLAIGFGYFSRSLEVWCTYYRMKYKLQCYILLFLGRFSSFHDILM